MSFRNEGQAAAACRVLCRRALLDDHADELRAEPLWTSEGPTRRAVAMLQGDIPLSGGERTVLQTAFALWNGDESATVADLLRLDGRNLADVVELLSAWNLGERAVAGWLAEREDAP